LYFTSNNGVPFFKSEIIPYPHGFSTREGGVSTEPHLKTLNLAFGRGDTDETVRQNIKIFTEAVGASGTVIYADQIHSNRVLYVDRSFEKVPQCDGFVTNKRGLILCVKIADCVPILLCDPENGVIAALHAGWRGTARNIVGEGIKLMQKYGAVPHNMKAAIGPAIHSCCYEVQADFISQFKSEIGSALKNAYIETRNGKTYCDIVGANAELLQIAGVKPENIDISDKCTCCEPETFFSHRATGGKRGTMAGIIEIN